MYFSQALVLAIGAATQLATATPIKARSFAIKDSHNVPAKWTKMMDAPANHVIELRIGVKQGDFDGLEKHLYEVSDPTHKRYGQHLSSSDVHDLIRPSEDSLKLVQDWLQENAVEPTKLSYSAAKDWIIASLPVSQIERLLDTKYHVYGHEDGDMMVRTPEWSLPEYLHDHIDTIQPTNSFYRASPKGRNLKSVPKTADTGSTFHPVYLSNPTVANACNASGITPTCLRVLYGTYDYQVQAAGKNKVGLTDYLGESNNRSDTSIFLKQFRPEAAAAAESFRFISINNGTTAQTNRPKGTDEEGNLDVETILGIDWPTPLIAYTTGGSPPFKADNNTPTDTNEPYLAWVEYVLHTSDENIAQTISTSYDDDEQSVPPSFAKRVCNEFAQLGARGVSLFFASGDDGVGSNGSCISNDGSNKPYFLPEFPSTCPYITSVGATKGFSPEVVAFDARNGFASGGGFSDTFPRPKYQDKVVPAYVKSLNGEFSAYYNQEGRGYPDLAAQGVAFDVIYNGSLIHLDGTSAATPTAAAVFALVNDALIAAGRKPLGFLNPWLYNGGYKAFNDVTSGSAIGCAGLGSGLGFPAKQGWDAVTGWGTPNFKSILKSLGVEGKFDNCGAWTGYYA
ncbi:subtilisin-like protein [Myriangium duriaei CBS 260.36]|uniref:tripeptidyl-peptidase II n=1 Tax=Myriangium duriaei CBS 260.36 TaxID=1168546 RepID=A0A9P4MIW9_9PEZI|nr:subtilisin-like protein [Myriangium duriaei CBS 260.36]